MWALLLACGLAGDADGDGFRALADGGEDCDDTDPTRFPGAEEVCDGVDQDCNGQVDDAQMTDLYTDADGDGWGDDTPIIACAGTEGLASRSGDCDDTDPTVNPGATEVCNGVDEDCDQGVDEDAADAAVWYLDSDGDGYGDTEVTDCEAGAGYAAEGGDCLDEGDIDGVLFAGDVNPGAPELCNGYDDDCDGLVDEDLSPAGCAGAAAARWTTTRPSTRLGTVQARADLDGDGVDEVLLGAPGESCGAECGGALYVCGGGSGAVDVDDCVGRVEADEGELGTAATLADLAGEGVPDLVVAAPQADCGGTDRGAVYVWPAASLAAGPTDTASARVVCGASTRSQWDRVEAADLDGDGDDDLLLADDYGSGVVVHLLSGGTTLPVDVADEATRARVEQTGTRVAVTGGDLDGDGLAEMVLAGSANGRVYLCAGADLARSGRLEGEVAAPASCTLVAGSTSFGATALLVPDLGGDGLDDLVLGDPGFDGERVDTGRYLFYSDPALVTSTSPVAWGELRGDRDTGTLGATGVDVAGSGAETTVAIGQPTTTTSVAQEGVVWVAVGLPGTSTLLVDLAVATVPGAERYAQLGADPALGDWTGDGVLDVLVGAPYGATGVVYGFDGAAW